MTAHASRVPHTLYGVPDVSQRLTDAQRSDPDHLRAEYDRLVEFTAKELMEAAVGAFPGQAMADDNEYLYQRIKAQTERLPMTEAVLAKCRQYMDAGRGRQGD